MADVKQEIEQKATDSLKDAQNKVEEAQKSVQEQVVSTEKAIEEGEKKAEEVAKEVVTPVVPTAEKSEAKPEIKVSPKTEVKEAAKPEPKAKPRPVVKPVAAKPVFKPVPSNINKEIFAGDEEIIYCLYYLGLQTDQHNLTLASEFFAGTTVINKARFDKIADLAHKYYDNASEAEMKNMANICSKVITPQNRDKQNQIIRAMNKAIGY